MRKFLVTYYETYKKTYEINAVDENEAKEELRFQLENGWVDGPDQCCDSDISDVEEVESED